VRKPRQVKLYVEGGGDSDATHTELRQAFTTLLKAAGVQKLPRVVACGGGPSTLDDFKNAVERSGSTERAFVLVDSESAVTEGDSVWAHLDKEYGWKKPPEAEESTAFLMIQCMETWLIADLDAVIEYFKPHFNRKSIAAWPDLEAVPKKTIQAALGSATAGGRAYAKGKISFEILSTVEPAKLEAACPAAKRFFDAMRAL
jgi:hypothetical protein